MTGTRPLVALTRRLPPEVERALAVEFQLIESRADRQLGVADLADLATQADGLLATVTDPLTADVFAANPLRCRIVANFGVGYNHIDVPAARARGVVVTNTPGVLTDDTADLAIALLLASARRMGEGEREVRDGRWEGWRPTHLLGTRVSGKTLGIIGFGRIGRAVARRAFHGFGMRILVHTPHEPRADALTAVDGKTGSLQDVLGGADFVSLHVPATPATRHLMDRRRLAMMRPGAFLINTSRGDVVDEAALAAALESGALAGAGLDVYQREPAVPEALKNRPNVVLLPHLGSATRESRDAMGFKALENLIAFFAGRTPPDLIP